MLRDAAGRIVLTTICVILLYLHAVDPQVAGVVCSVMQTALHPGPGGTPPYPAE